MHGKGVTVAIRLLVAAALLLAPAAAPAHAERAGAAAGPLRLQPPAHGWLVRSTALKAHGSRALARASWSGGTYTTPSGEPVTVYVSPSYPDANAVGRRWADYIAALLHGSELTRARTYIAPHAEVQDFCRNEHALGCYGGNQIVSIGEAVDGVSPEEVVRHEYGHHVAANRQNAPWEAVDWGTKRWASRADICRRAASGTAFPGDEGLHYALNPGEAFAEAYRVLNEVQAGSPSFAWSLADVSFRPDNEALTAVEQDVLRPWVQPPSRVVRGRFAVRTRSWSVGVSTPLDGDAEFRLTMPLGAGHALELLDERGSVLCAGSGLRPGSGRSDSRSAGSGNCSSASRGKPVRRGSRCAFGRRDGPGRRSRGANRRDRGLPPRRRGLSSRGHRAALGRRFGRV